MAGVLQHLRSSTLNKRPNPASMVDGQIAINYASGSPGAFFKDTNGNLVKVGPVHVGATAPNVSPASGGTAGNSLGEQWLDTSGGTYVFKIWDGAAWRSEAGEFVNSTGDTMTGSLTMGPSANLIFEGSTDDGFETTLTVVDPTADRTITLPNVSGTVVTTGDSGTVTSTMIADGAIVNADVNASAAIAGTKISPDFGSQNVATTGTATAASFIPSSSSVPLNGLYLPSSNNVAISANSVGRLFVAADGTVSVKGAGTAAFSVNGGAPNNSLVVNSSGRVGLGTSSPVSELDLAGSVPVFTLKSSTNTGSGTPILSSIESYSSVYGLTNAKLSFLQGTSGYADLGGIALYTKGFDGLTERMRILSDGNVVIGKAGQTISYQNPGINLFSSGSADFTRASAYLISVNRKTDDGVLVEFYQDNNLEGTISVSGTTVSYNGAHLSRWSQLPTGAERTEILRGTVLSNIDEMCEWGDEDNEQLNRMKVSDVEGDKNVAGVFQAWDDDDDTYTNDFYCAMTGDFIIRIAQGVTVERGDLLMSAGDGTAKPQDDDIIRSKTIAKVTSTNVSCTYDDGSYCVPCVLMAC